MKKNLLFIFILVSMIFYAGTIYADDVSVDKNQVQTKGSLSEFDRFFQTLISDETVISSAAGSILNLSVVAQNKIQDMGKVKKGIAVVAGISLKF